MRPTKRLLALATLCCAALGSPAYAGQDLKTLAGSACQFTDPAEIIFSKDISFAFDGGRIRNVGTTDVPVVCPIVRDNINNTGVFSVGVRVQGVGDEFVLCTLKSRDLFGKEIGPDDFATGGDQGPELGECCRVESRRGGRRSGESLLAGGFRPLPVPQSGPSLRFQLPPHRT